MGDWFKLEELLFSAFLAATALGAIWLLPRFLAGVPFVPPKEVKARLDKREDVLLLDVRNPSELTDALGHIRGSVNLPLSELSQKLEEIQPRLRAYQDTPIIVLCRTSNRAASAARLLKKAGLPNVSVMAGGMARWKREGLPSKRTL